MLRRVGLVSVGLLLVAAIAVFAISWYFASVLITPDHETDYADTVISAGARTVTLDRSDATDEPGIYGLYWQIDGKPAGHAILGELISQTDDRVVRKLSGAEVKPAPKTKVFVGPNVWQGNPRETLGIPYRPVNIETELGPAPAWFVPGRSKTWAILVHGINANRQAGLRLMPALRRLGMPMLDITYRNDVGAPKAPDGKIHLGATEWRDLDAAVAYANAHGAKRIVPIGMSMGGAIVAEFWRNSKRTANVPRLVLDAPALNWSRVLDLAADERGLPTQMVGVVESIVEHRIDVNLDDLDQLAHSSSFHLPILLFHGSDDKVVPVSISKDFARELPAFVALHIFGEAGHVRSWNVNRRAYERYLTRFLRPVAKP